MKNGARTFTAKSRSNPSSVSDPQFELRPNAALLTPDRSVTASKSSHIPSIPMPPQFRLDRQGATAVLS